MFALNKQLFLSRVQETELSDTSSLFRVCRLPIWMLIAGSNFISEETEERKPSSSSSSSSALLVFCNLRRSMACIVPCLISRDYKFKAANFEGFSSFPFIPKRPSFPLTCIEFLHFARRELFRRDFTLHKVNVWEKRRGEKSANDNRVRLTRTRHVIYLNSHELSGLPADVLFDLVYGVSTPFAL